MLNKISDCKKERWKNTPGHEYNEKQRNKRKIQKKTDYPLD